MERLFFEACSKAVFCTAKSPIEVPSYTAKRRTCGTPLWYYFLKEAEAKGGLQVLLESWEAALSGGHFRRNRLER